MEKRNIAMPAHLWKANSKSDGAIHHGVLVRGGILPNLNTARCRRKTYTG